MHHLIRELCCSFALMSKTDDSQVVNLFASVQIKLLKEERISFFSYDLESLTTDMRTVSQAENFELRTSTNKGAEPLLVNGHP